MKKVELKGVINGSLKYLKRTTHKDEYGRYYWLCRCLLCNKRCYRPGGSNAKSCGCIKKDLMKKAKDRRDDIINRHKEGESFTDIAEALGISKQRVSQIASRKYLEEE